MNSQEIMHVRKITTATTHRTRCIVSVLNEGFCVVKWIEPGSGAGMRMWLGESQVMDGWGLVAMCIDVEATMCLVMRVERDGWWAIGMIWWFV
jgi:hypothetical protein